MAGSERSGPEGSSCNLSENDERVLRRIFEPHLPDCGETEEQEQQWTGVEEVVSAETEEARRLELEGVKTAARGDLSAALDLFDRAIQLAPDRPSGYNNRAQTLRLLHDTSGAMSDLDRAISLSGGIGAAACQAFTQRALLRRLLKDEDGAVDDFKHAAQLGGKFAKTQLARLNPYAALCGAAVAEMMRASLKPVVPSTTSSGPPPAV